MKELLEQLSIWSNPEKSLYLLVIIISQIA